MAKKLKSERRRAAQCRLSKGRELKRFLRWEFMMPVFSKLSDENLLEQIDGVYRKIVVDKTSYSLLRDKFYCTSQCGALAQFLPESTELQFEKEHSASCSPPQISFSEANFIENGFKLPPDALTKDDETGEVKRAAIDGFAYYRYHSGHQSFYCGCSNSSIRLNSDYTHYLQSGAHTAGCLQHVAKKQAKRPPEEYEIDDKALVKDEKTDEIKEIHWDGKR